jgi:glycosyltransferase involved in cell wall biosynthesis
MIFKKPHLYVAFRIVKFLMRLCLSKVDAIVVHSHITYNLVVAAFPALKAKLYVIPIPIEPVAPSSQPLREKADGDKWIILPGFVTPYKGHIVAIQALQYLPNNYKLVIAGGVHPKNKKAANYWSELLSCIDSLSMMSRVYITGFIESANDQANLFGLADAFLLPYEEVGQSGSAVLADALAQDKPVITSLAQSMFVYRMNPETADSSIAVSMKRPRKIASLIKSAVEEDDIRRSSRISALERVYSLYGASASRKAYHQMFDKITR